MKYLSPATVIGLIVFIASTLGSLTASAKVGGNNLVPLMRGTEVSEYPADKECNEIVGTIDLLPTFAALSGATLPERKINGKDIAASNDLKKEHPKVEARLKKTLNERNNEINQNKRLADKPNLIYVMADDCTYRDLGCYGGQAYTPNIDRLAQEGMLFERCFQAAPMCSPTRHNIYTGLYPVKTGAYPNHTFAKDGTRSIVDFLKPLGYRVALSGKTHIAPKKVFPFEYSGKDSNPDMAAIDKLMAESKAAGIPFCLFATSNEPHSPHNKGDPSRYPPEKIKLPPYYVDTPALREAFSKYLAEVTYYDGQVGDILKLLEKHGLAGNTLVMVTSEQGNEFPFAKWTCYDNGLQSAMICRWPEVIQPGSRAAAMVEYVDICPTFIDAAGGKPPALLDGKSFMDVLKGKTDHHKDYVYGIMTTRGIIDGSDHYGIRSVRSGTHKLIVNLSPDADFQNVSTQGAIFKSWEAKAAEGDIHAAGLVARYKKRPAIELYDIIKDPLEMDNIAGNPENSLLIKELQAKLNSWMKDQGDLGAQTEMEALEHQSGNRNKAIKSTKSR